MTSKGGSTRFRNDKELQPSTGKLLRENVYKVPMTAYFIRTRRNTRNKGRKVYSEFVVSRMFSQRVIQRFQSGYYESR